MEFRTLRECELDQWVDHCGGVFVKTGAAYFRRHYEYDPWRCLDSIFVAVEGERILSTVRVFHRRAYVNGVAVRMGGIGEVSTKPEAQRQGLSSRLLTMACAYMAENGFEIATLSTGIHSHYEKVGFKRIPLRFAHLSLEGAGVGGAEPVAKEDILALAGIYGLRAPNINGAMTRDNDFYWNHWVAYEMNNPYILKDGDSHTAGYVSYDVDGTRLTIQECMMLPGFESQALPILRAMREQYGLPKDARAPLCMFPDAPVHADKEDNLMALLIKPFDTPHGCVNDTDGLCALLSHGADLRADGF